MQSLNKIMAILVGLFKDRLNISVSLVQRDYSSVCAHTTVANCKKNRPESYDMTRILISGIKVGQNIKTQL